ncbi:31797_t:CDS:2 [Gigaspora margarita]|uniref:31797_t:CDS:1 n=1 Tax=Gigaspora margarita TaxID=4874 RepID=A0ABN7UC15_GIGMA|nr:31797_t:CDS:2 [Gigaspora margarita]
MKKVHNTRSNGEEIITASQKTIHTKMGVKIPFLQAQLAQAQKRAQSRRYSWKNSTGFEVEGSGNLCDGQSDEVISPDLHTGVSSINIDAISDSNKKIRNDVPNKETKLWSERVETSVNVELSITLSLASNKENIAPVNLMANNRESAWKVNNTLHDQSNPINSRNEDITQPKKNNEFTEYKMQTSREATNIVRNPALPASSNRSEILQYIRYQFEALYQDEPVNIEAIEALTNDLLSELQQQNKALIKEISLQKITNTIDRLPNYKAPGSDGLIYDLNIIGDTAKNLTIANATNYLKKLSISSIGIYYFPLAKNDDEGSTSKEKNLKYEEGKLSLKTVLESLADAYFEVLKNLILELTKLKEPEP